MPLAITYNYYIDMTFSTTYMPLSVSKTYLLIFPGWNVSTALLGQKGFSGYSSSVVLQLALRPSFTPQTRFT